MTCHVRRAFDLIFLLQIVHQKIVERMRSFGCASKFGNFVEEQDKPSVMIEGGWRGEIDIL